MLDIWQFRASLQCLQAGCRSSLAFALLGFNQESDMQPCLLWQEVGQKSNPSSAWQQNSQAVLDSFNLTAQ